jgi:dTDP-4-dehydrorhamnose 3,5-epimerase
LSLRETALAGVLVFAAPPATDARGSFSRLADRAELAAAGVCVDFPQWSVAANAVAGTLRGLHYAAPPHTEAKLVRVVAGAIFDVVLDVRAGSATFGRWASFELRADIPETLFVPAGCAHGYQTRVTGATVVYGISCAYVAAAARGVDPFDPALAIPWPLAVTAISERDRTLPPLVRAEAIA